MGRRIYDDDDYDRNCCQRNVFKIVVITCLVVCAIGLAATLTYIYMKQVQRERALVAKKNTWSKRLEQCEPVFKIAGPLIKTIVKVAFSVILL